MASARTKVPKAPTTPSAARVASTRRALLLGGAAAAALLLVAGAVALLGGRGGSSTQLQTTADGRFVQASPVRAMFGGIPQQGLTLGSPTAPVTLVEYFDLQCPVCRAFELDVTPAVLTRYVRTGKVRIEARPLAFIGPDSVRGRNALLAAAAQNHAFDFAELLFANQGAENSHWLSDRVVDVAAASIAGVDPTQLRADSGTEATATAAAAFDADATADHINAVPTVIVKRTGAQGTGRTLVNPSEGQLTAALDAAGA